MSSAPQDIVVVIDNSGSMRWNDPHFLAKSAVQRLVEGIEPGSRLAIVVFDADSRLVIPLTEVNGGTHAQFAEAIAKIDYRGPWTDIPGAVERAIYHLRQSGRPEVPHEILFLTDGIVDTGDAARDQDRTQWLLDELIPLAVRSDIRIFSIAFSEEADYRLVQTLAMRTSADYARVLDPNELAATFTRLMHSLQQPRPVSEPPMVVPVVAPTPAPAPQPVATSDVVQAEGAEQVYGPWMWLVLALVVLGSGLWWWRSRGSSPGLLTGAEVEPPGAILLDIAGISGFKRLDLNTAKTVIGRKPAPGPEIVTSIVLEQHTISRKHATITWRDGAYWIEDHRSSNGTYVDGDQITEPTQLRDGSKLRFDVFEFEFRIPLADATQVRGAEEAEEEFNGEHTMVRGEQASTTIFKPQVGAADDVWADFDDAVIDTVLQEYEDSEKDK